MDGLAAAKQRDKGAGQRKGISLVAGVVAQHSGGGGKAAERDHCRRTEEKVRPAKIRGQEHWRNEAPAHNRMEGQGEVVMARCQRAEGGGRREEEAGHSTLHATGIRQPAIPDVVAAVSRRESQSNDSRRRCWCRVDAARTTTGARSSSSCWCAAPKMQARTILLGMVGRRGKYAVSKSREREQRGREVCGGRDGGTRSVGGGEGDHGACEQE